MDQKEIRGEARPRRSKGRWLPLLLVLLLVLGTAGGVTVLAGSLRGVEIVPVGQQAPRPLPGYILAGSPEAEAAGLLSRELSATEIYQRVSGACVGVRTSVTATNAFGQMSSRAINGSGFLISADGYIVTNYHVIEAAYTEGHALTVMLLSGEEYPAAILGGDADNDVALLKIEGENFPFAVIGDYSAIQVGETVYTIGNPLGELTYTMTSGIVSALDRSIATDASTAISMFQTDAAINQGNSGGPVFNARGEVIGIASAKYASSGVEGLGFAIPISDAMGIVDDLAKYGYVPGKPLMGIMVGTASYYGMEEDGAVVLEVEPGSCAERAGLREGDLITALDGQPIAGTPELLEIKNAYRAGDTVTLTVLREGERLELSMTLDEKKPAAPKSGSP